MGGSTTAHQDAVSRRGPDLERGYGSYEARSFPRNVSKLFFGVDYKTAMLTSEVKKCTKPRSWHGDSIRNIGNSENGNESPWALWKLRQMLVLNCPSKNREKKRQYQNPMAIDTYAEDFFTEWFLCRRHCYLRRASLTSWPYCSHPRPRCISDFQNSF